MEENERILRLILGNRGDEVALKNICEAQGVEMEGLSESEKEFYIHTNQFYDSVENFCELHREDIKTFQSLVAEGVIVKTADGFIYKNCV